MYLIKLYMSLTTSVYFKLAIWVIFISPIQSVNGLQFLILLLSFFHLIASLHHHSCASNCYSFTYKYIRIAISLKFGLYIEILKLIWLLVSYVSRESSFILTYHFVVNLVGWFSVFSNKFIYLFVFWSSIINLLC